MGQELGPRYYAKVGRLIGLLFSLVMISTVCTIHLYRVSETLDDLTRMFFSILGGDLLSLFVVGMVILRVDSRAAMTATAVTVFSVCGWLFVDTPLSRQLPPLVCPHMSPTTSGSAPSPICCSLMWPISRAF